MTPFDDDRTDMNLLGGTTPLSDSDVDALLSGRAVPGFDDVHSTVRVLRAAAPPLAPVPSDALLAVMEAGFDPLPLADAEPDVTALARWQRWGARLALSAAAVLATTVGAAAANALPAPVQNAVASAVGALTPLDLPRREAERALVEQEPEVDGGSRTGTGSGSASRSEAPPAGVTMPDVDVSPEDLAPRTPGQVAQPSPGQSLPAQSSPAQSSPAQPTAGVPAPTARDERDEPDTDERGEPDTDEPDQTDRLELDEPDIDEPDIDEPDTEEPDTELDEDAQDDD